MKAGCGDDFPSHAKIGGSIYQAAIHSGDEFGPITIREDGNKVGAVCFGSCEGGSGTPGVVGDVTR